MKSRKYSRSLFTSVMLVDKTGETEFRSVVALNVAKALGENEMSSDFVTCVRQTTHKCHLDFSWHHISGADSICYNLFQFLKSFVE